MLRFHLFYPAFMACLLFTVFTTSSCNKDDDVMEEPSLVSVSDDELHFFHAWIADCINDLYFSGQTLSQELLVQLAKARIEGLVTNEQVITAYGQTELVWGPQLIVNPDQPGSADYTSGNLMYCLKSNTGTSAQVFYVGIAGTNSIAYYDWFTEDMDVSTQVEWAPGKGKLSEGSYTGLQHLMTMQDPTTSLTLEKYISRSAAVAPSVQVHVAGHSLGGALTQAYSAYLRDMITSPRVIISAWVYAGPTAGDETFAQTLVADLHSGNYHAYNNSLDVVPHAWQTDELSEICSLYQNRTLCGFSLSPLSTVNAVTKYLETISSGGLYKQPGTPIPFTETLPAYEDCNELITGIEALYYASEFPYARLNRIHKKCNPGSSHIDLEEFGGFITFLLEMDRQHTTAYFNHFVTDPDLRTTISAYMSGECSTGIIKDTALLGHFLGKIEAQSITDCSCN